MIERAREILALHEKTEHAVTEELAPRPAAPMQIQMFEPVNYQIAERIRNLEAGRAAAHRGAAIAERAAAGAEALMRVAGLMSGTSLDGIDVAVVDIGDSIQVVSFTTRPYPPRGARGDSGRFERDTHARSRG